MAILVRNRPIEQFLMLGIMTLVLGSTLLGVATTNPQLTRYEYSQIEMGVPFKILLYAPDSTTANRAAEAAFARIHELNAILSDYDPQSELSRLSAASPTAKPVPVSDPLWLVLSRSQQLARQSGGAFDITVGPYVKLWRRARRDKQMPSAERLAQARARVGYQLLELDAAKQSASLRQEGMQLDLGGIAMGFAIDEALAVIKKHGITRALVDGSGDIAAGDPPPDAPGWRIGVAPLGREGTPSRYVLLCNIALTTSGDAFQHVEIAGQRYSHIVDPKTGLGLTTRTGVTVIAKDCITADSLATAVSVLGPTAGLKLIEKTPGAAVLIVREPTGKPEIVASPDFEKYVTQTPSHPPSPEK